MTFTKNYVPWNKNKTHSEETRQKMSENNSRHWLGKKFSTTHRNNISKGHKGIKYIDRKRPFITELHRRNLSIATAAYWKEHYHERRAQLLKGIAAYWKAKKKHGNKT